SLPDFRARLEIPLEHQNRNRERALPSFRTKPRVDVVDDALGGGTIEKMLHRLDEHLILLERARVLDVAVVKDDEVEIRVHGQLDAAELAQRHHCPAVSLHGGGRVPARRAFDARSEEHTSELQSQSNL